MVLKLVLQCHLDPYSLKMHIHVPKFYVVHLRYKLP